jgi:tetratricopeptide (TPR) repeat protein
VATAPAAPSRTPATRPAPAEKVDENSPYGQALKQLKANQLPDAEAALLAVAKANPQASGPHANLGIVYVRSKRLPEARAAFARAVAINPGNAVAHNWLGVLAREAGDYARAEQSYRAAIAADAGYAPALLNLAILYDLHLKQPAAALEAYRQYEQATDRKDARAAVWIAEIEATAAAAQAPKSGPEPARPAAGKPMGGVSQ